MAISEVSMGTYLTNLYLTRYPFALCPRDAAIGIYFETLSPLLAFDTSYNLYFLNRFNGILIPSHR